MSFLLSLIEFIYSAAPLILSLKSHEPRDLVRGSHTLSKQYLNSLEVTILPFLFGKQSSSWKYIFFWRMNVYVIASSEILYDEARLVISCISLVYSISP